MTTLLFISLALLFIIYFGYGLIIFVYNRFNPFETKLQSASSEELPDVALLIPAYNEESVIAEKIENSLSLEYPADKLHIYVISDGSTDKTNEIVSGYPQVKLLNQPVRRGKSAAINRAVPLLKESIVVFTDANVSLSGSAILELCALYVDAKTGGVSGEKVVLKDQRAAAASTEGLYWKYESFLKREDARLSTMVGAAGELFSIRRELFVPIPDDSILDDFILSMNIIRQGYKVDYAPKALAIEKPSAGIEDEYKRKVRISAGGIQSTMRTLDFFNPGKYGIISFQYIIHRISRWTISPILLLTALISSFFTLHEGTLYSAIFIVQILFYGAALIGWVNKSNKKMSSKIVNISFYFVFMHFCVVAGWIRYFSGNQKAAWQKATRLVGNA